MPRARRIAAYVRVRYEAFNQPRFECGCCEMLVFRAYGVRQNLFMCLIFTTPLTKITIFFTVY